MLNLNIYRTASAQLKQWKYSPSIVIIHETAYIYNIKKNRIFFKISKIDRSFSVSLSSKTCNIKFRGWNWSSKKMIVHLNKFAWSLFQSNERKKEQGKNKYTIPLNRSKERDRILIHNATLIRWIYTYISF